MENNRHFGWLRKNRLKIWYFRVVFRWKIKTDCIVSQPTAISGNIKTNNYRNWSSK